MGDWGSNIVGGGRLRIKICGGGKMVSLLKGGRWEIWGQNMWGGGGEIGTPVSPPLKIMKSFGILPILIMSEIVLLLS